jgi:hypothetical protein
LGLLLAPKSGEVRRDAPAPCLFMAGLDNKRRRDSARLFFRRDPRWFHPGHRGRPSAEHHSAFQLISQDAVFGGPIFVPSQQLLVHRPCDVGQDARPIHNGVFAPPPCGGDRPKSTGTPPPRLCGPRTTDRPTSRFSLLTLRHSRPTGLGSSSVEARPTRRPRLADGQAIPHCICCHTQPQKLAA